VHGYVRDANPTMGGPSDLVINLRFANEAIGSYAAAYLAVPTPNEPNGLRLYGTEGTAAWRGTTVLVSHADGSAEEHEFETDGGYYNQFINFYEAIVYGEPIVGTIEQSFLNLAVVMLALDSAESGRVLESPDAGRETTVGLWRPRGAQGLFDGLPCVHKETKV